jgi:hypothetical protein
MASTAASLMKSRPWELRALAALLNWPSWMRDRVRRTFWSGLDGGCLFWRCAGAEVWCQRSMNRPSENILMHFLMMAGLSRKRPLPPLLGMKRTHLASIRACVQWKMEMGFSMSSRWTKATRQDQLLRAEQVTCFRTVIRVEERSCNKMIEIIVAAAGTCKGWDNWLERR